MISVIGMLLLLYDEYVVCKTMRSRYQSFLFDSVVKWKKDLSVFLIDCEGVVVDKPVTPDDRKPGKILFIHLIEN